MNHAGRIANALWVLLVWASCGLAQGVLPSWNDSATRQAIVSFVERVTTPGSARFVAPAERIAVFDNDGTLWSEQPMYVQLAFALDRVKTLAADHPEWKEKAPFSAVLSGDFKAVAAGGERALVELMMATHAGMTTDEFEQIVRDWVATARHPVYKRPYTECVYEPMRELLAYLRDHGFKTYIVSGGGVEFMRPWVDAVYGIPPEQVIGSSIKLKYEVRDGKPVLVRLPELDFIDDKAGKPVGIQRIIGRRPILAVGNSDGDYEMLEYVTAGKGTRLGVLLHHTDGDREAAYDRASSFGRLDRGLNDAAGKGWSVIDMKRDWRQVFPAAGVQEPDAPAASSAARTVPARPLPTPATVSPQLARVLAQPIATLPVPRTAEEWKQLQGQLDGVRSENTRKLAAATGVRLEETTIAGVKCYRVLPAKIAAAHADRLLVHTHGGAYVLGAGVGAAQEAVLIANACETEVLSIDYRMPPDHPFPAALDDATAVWRELLRKHPAERMALLGTSAGGGLAMALVHQLKESKLPLPTAMFVGTPASDLTKTGDSYFTNAEVCNGLGRYEGFLGESLKLYAGQQDMKQPLLSPVYGDFRNFPPTLLVSGTRDLFLSNTVRVHRRMREAGVVAELHVYEGQSHADYLRVPDSPESQDLFREIAAFMDRSFGR